MTSLRVVTIVGARPQFVKAAALSRELRKTHNEVLVHTGQHYSENMSDVFFDELQIPKPDYNLGIGSGRHSAQTGAMMVKIEEILREVNPQAIIVYGDTNSTMAAALAAAKLVIPIIHIEAGLRSYNRVMPEEVNRVAVDHISRILLCPSRTAVANLKSEGITLGVFEVGDLMYDILKLCCEALDNRKAENPFFTEPYLLATIHRQENTQNRERLQNILMAFKELSEPILLPLHPRTKNAVADFGIDIPGNVRVVDPLGYLDMLRAQRGAKCLLTDSGGLQKEAYWLKLPCVTLREETEWVETVDIGANTLVGSDPLKIVNAVAKAKKLKDYPDFYGDGFAAQACVKAIEKGYESLSKVHS